MRECPDEILNHTSASPFCLKFSMSPLAQVVGKLQLISIINDKSDSRESLAMLDDFQEAILGHDLLALLLLEGES